MHQLGIPQDVESSDPSAGFDLKQRQFAVNAGYVNRIRLSNFHQILQMKFSRVYNRTLS